MNKINLLSIIILSIIIVSCSKHGKNTNSNLPFNPIGAKAPSNLFFQFGFNTRLDQNITLNLNTSGANASKCVLGINGINNNNPIILPPQSQDGSAKIYFDDNSPNCRGQEKIAVLKAQSNGRIATYLEFRLNKSNYWKGVVETYTYYNRGDNNIISLDNAQCGDYTDASTIRDCNDNYFDFAQPNSDVRSGIVSISFIPDQVKVTINEPADGGVYSSPYTYTLQGNGVPYATIAYNVDNQSYGTVKVSPSSGWVAYDAPSPLDDGKHTISIAQNITHKATGNTYKSAQISNTFTVGVPVQDRMMIFNNTPNNITMKLDSSQTTCMSTNVGNETMSPDQTGADLEVYTDKSGNCYGTLVKQIAWKLTNGNQQSVITYKTDTANGNRWGAVTVTGSITQYRATCDDSPCKYRTQIRDNGVFMFVNLGPDDKKK